jgi:hypothetical protein
MSVPTNVIPTEVGTQYAVHLAMNRDAHGCRPVPASALTGARGAGMTSMVVASFGEDVIPAKAGT